MIAIFKREVRSSFHGMIGYVLTAFMLAATAIYFIALNLGYGLTDFGYYTLNRTVFVLLLYIPVLTMRCFAEERRTRTDQLLLTSPVSVWGIVLGKFLALCVIFALPCLVDAVMILVLAALGASGIATAANFAALLCYFLMGCAAIAIGVFLSSLTENQIIAAVAGVAALLLAQAALALPLWRDMLEGIHQRRVSCAWGALLLTVACLGDCVWCMVKGGEHLPLAGAAALVTFCCEWGVYLRCAARRESFRLADLGGHPPWSVQKTKAGAIKCQGRLEGFYTHAVEPDMPQKWYNAVLPLLLATACVLTGVVCLSESKPAQPLWVCSALLAAATSLSWPLAGTLPTYFLSHRLSHSGCAVAGYSGAKAVSGAKRMVITDEDLYPAGTLSLNGMKIYGEELGRVLSYSVAMARAADSQALPLLEQMLSDQGGQAEALDDFRWYEEGGAGGTIHGETVLLGSAYFMRRQNVRLPKELKVPSGLFLAVDGQLTAIFALRYQPSRNVDWALRALRRNRVTPVLAVRGCNITPEFLRRSFKVDAKPIYPDVQTRLSLLEQARLTGPAYAVVYRDGLMPYAETVLGSRKLLLAARWTIALALLASAAGLLLCYYLTGIGGYASLTPLRLVLFQLLWLLPGLLLAGQVKHF